MRLHNFRHVDPRCSLWKFYVIHGSFSSIGLTRGWWSGSICNPQNLQCYSFQVNIHKSTKHSPKKQNLSKIRKTLTKINCCFFNSRYFFNWNFNFFNYLDSTKNSWTIIHIISLNFNTTLSQKINLACEGLWGRSTDDWEMRLS